MQSSNKVTTKIMQGRREESTFEKKEKNHPYSENVEHILGGYNAPQQERTKQNSPDKKLSSPQRDTHNSLNAGGPVNTSPSETPLAGLSRLTSFLFTQPNTRYQHQAKGLLYFAIK